LTEKDLESGQDNTCNVISLTVDHDLQSSSSAMAEQCSKIAQAIGAEHLTYKVPWSDPPAPPRPAPGQAFENTARTARYHGLFQLMTRSNTNVIAFGHHSDDQIETSLIRLGRGSTELGVGGMKPCRRWGMGMGIPEGFGWAGYEGMNKWIVRPLLGVSKVRSAATALSMY
jgi:tRNA(Ile)-lysidine synthase